MTTCTVVSFDGSSDVGYKIVMQRTDGSRVTLTTLAVITKAGMKHIPSQLLKEMSGTSGILEIEVTKENGNEYF